MPVHMAFAPELSTGPVTCQNFTIIMDDRVGTSVVWTLQLFRISLTIFLGAAISTRHHSTAGP
ncbi:hypothetical protein DESC_700051 [Desulfosarcina cetonica]|nr:hypothetical protein DESC_700051 [Desulfosarcina cetonica]